MGRVIRPSVGNICAICNGTSSRDCAYCNGTSIREVQLRGVGVLIAVRPFGAVRYISSTRTATFRLPDLLILLLSLLECYCGCSLWT
jgi:hypothetical protein